MTDTPTVTFDVNPETTTAITTVEQLEQKKLESKEVAAADYEKLLAIYLAQNDFTNAKFLWERIPEQIKESSTSLKLIWEVGKCLITNDFAGVYGKIDGHTWPSHLSSTMEQFRKDHQSRLIPLIAKDYTTISMDEMIKMTGCSAEENIVKLGESVDWKADVPFGYNIDKDASIDEAVSYLNDVHNQCLKMFVLTAFDMNRYMMITPKKIAYAKQKEQQLFESLMVIANKKQEEIKNLISNTIISMREEILFSHEAGLIESDLVKSLNEKFHETNSTLNLSTSSSCNESTICLTSREIQLAMVEVQDFVLSKLNAAIADKLIGSIDYLRNSYVGTLERCLESLENWSPHCDILSPPPPPPPLPSQPSLPTTSSSSVSSTSQSRGQSQSSPSSLTSSAFPLSMSKNECIQASNALKQILNAAYQVEINMRTSSSLLRAFWDKMKQLVSVSLSWRNQTVINDEWKRKVAADVLGSLSESRLAKSICAQFKDRLRKSHTQFTTAMKQLENLHYGRLEKIEELRDRVRKYYAPRIARCALEATSLRDVILHGMPELGREIGRGQYGVVYSCDSWAGYSPVAVKSVVPPDEKHWNDLAMEFYYTRSIPKHNRIVQIRGSVIDYSYGNGSNPAVLLIMDRLSRDLYSAIKNGLDWLSRLQVAIDVVQGIRFLHSQGLVHRDIKLKNVLLDKRNRAKITDLGFCKPEAMMSGSIVGTPIHMAPELFTGKYDNSVDVYAFGILFWYICAGHVRLPFIFEQCQNKDQLWTCVRKGLRPERIPEFDSECWEIMEACWAKEPSNRPYLGDIELKLVSILKRKTEKH